MAQRKRRGWMVGVGAAMALPLLWVGAHQFSLPRSKASLLWTERDLPPLPPQAQNGWVVLQAHPGPIGGALTRDALAEVKSWEEASGARGEWASELDEEATARLWKTWEAVWALPQFADACPLGLTPANPVLCKAMELLHAHALAEAKALAQAMDGQWEEAFLLAGHLLRVDAQHLNSARTLLAHQVAVANYERSLRLTALLNQGYAHRLSPATPAFVPHQAELLAHLELLEEPGLHLQRGVVSEYLWAVAALEQLGSEGLTALAFDRESTLGEMNARFSQAMSFAQAPNEALPPPAPPKMSEGFGWWLYNPIGKRMLDSMALNIGSAVERFERSKEEILAQRAELRSQLSQPVPRR